MNYAPIALFVYNRPEHTQKTVAHLLANKEAALTDLYIFSDAAKNATQIENVNLVREYIQQITGFKSIQITERESNLGLANSIIDGVTKVVNKHGKIIVFEDDLICSPYTLQYFNDALDFYENHKNVMHINAYRHNINFNSTYDTFLFRAASSWGWATWKNSWQHFESNIEVLYKQFDQQKIKNFSIDYSMNFWKQVNEFRAHKNNSWAIRWYSSVFLNGGLCVTPKASLINNIGADGTGIHSGLNNIYDVEIYLSPLNKENFYRGNEEDKEAYQAFKHFFKHRKGNLWQRAKRFYIEKIAKK